MNNGVTKGGAHDILCVLLLLFLAGIYVGPGLWGARAFGTYDLLNFQYPWGLSQHPHDKPSNPEASDFVHSFNPWRAHYHHSLRQGEVPLWNPHQFCGAPFAANDQSAVFYPLNLVYVALPVWWAFGVSVFIHLFLAGLFMYMFLRVLGAGRGGALIAGSAYMFTGWFMVWLQHASKIDAAVWAPLVFLFYELSLRRRGLLWPVLCALILGVQFTAGFLQISAYTAFALAIYAVVRVFTDRRNVSTGRAVISLFISGVLGVIIAMVHVLPVLDLARGMQRAAEGFGAGGFFSGVPLKWAITIFMPDALGRITGPGPAAQINYTEFCCYAGATALCLAVVSVMRRGREAENSPSKNSATSALAVIGLFGLLAAMGTPLYLLFYYLVPGAKTLAVGRIMFMFMFSVAALAGLGADAICRGIARGASFRAALLTLISAAILIAAIRFSGSHAPDIFSSGLLPQVIAFLIFVCCVPFIAFLRGKAGAGLAGAMLFALIIADQFHWGMTFSVKTDPKLAFPDTPSIAFLREQNRNDVFRIHATTYDPVRRQTMGPLLFPNTATVYGLDDIRGYDSLFPRRYQDFMEAMHTREAGAGFQRYTVVNTFVTVSPWLDFMNMKYLLGTAPPGGSGYEGAFYEKGAIPVYRNTRAMPRAFTVRRWKVLKSDRDTLNAMMDKEFDPWREVVLNTAPEGLSSHGKTSVPGVGARVVYRGANHITLRARGPGVLVMSEAWDPGWEAKVDGRPTKVLCANYTFRAIVLPQAGEHTVVMQYQPQSVRLGMILSLISLCGIILFLVSNSFRHMRTNRV